MIDACWDLNEGMYEMDYSYVYDEKMFPKLPPLNENQTKKISSEYTNIGKVAGNERRCMKEAKVEAHDELIENDEIHPHGKETKVGEYEDGWNRRCRDTQVLDDYVYHRYSRDQNLPLYKPQFYIELSDLHQKEFRRKNDVTNNSEKIKSKEKPTWRNLSQFTQADDLYQITGQQLKVCEFFADEEGLISEEDEDQEEEIKEISLKLKQRKRRKEKGKTRERRESVMDWGGLDKEMCVKAVQEREDPRCHVTVMPVKKEIWGLVQVRREGEGGGEGGEFHVALYDSGNLSKSLVSVSFIRKLERQWKRRIKLDKYDAPVRGVGGGKVELVGRVRDQLCLFIPGFSTYFNFRPIVTSGKMSHINISLSEMKQHQLSLHLLRNQTILQDFATKESVRLFDRESIFDKAIFQLEATQIAKITNKMRGKNDRETSCRDLRDLTKIENAIKQKLIKKQVLAEEKGSLKVYDTISEAWERDTRQEEAGEGEEEKDFKYNGNMRRDILAAKQLKMGDKIQMLRPWKNTKIEPNTHVYVPCKIKLPYGGSFLIYPGPETIVQAGGILVTPSINQLRDPQGLAYVSVMNLTNHPYHLKRKDTIGFMEAMMEEEEYEIERADRKERQLKEGRGEEKVDELGMHVKRKPPEPKEEDEDERASMEGDRCGQFRSGQIEEIKSHPPEEIVGQKGKKEERRPLEISEVEPSRYGLWRDIKSHPPEKERRQERRQSLWKEDKEKSMGRGNMNNELINDENFEHSGFILLDKEGKVEEYLSSGKEINRKSIWYNPGPGKDFCKMVEKGRLDETLYSEARRELEDSLNDGETRIEGGCETDRRHGQKTFSKQSKIKVNEVLKDLADKVNVGDSGTFIRGKIKDGKTDIDYSYDRQMIEEEEQLERKKKYLWELEENEIKKFLVDETRLMENEYLKERPLMRNLLLEIMFKYHKAFTPSPNHKYLKYDPGHCKQLIYHPELKPQFKEKIFTSKVQTFSPVDERELGKILRAWVRAGILRKQDITDPNSRSAHNHRLILIRKKPTDTNTGTDTNTETESGGSRAGTNSGDVGVMPEATRPKRLVLDLRELNSCSITHKHYMASVHDHLSMLEGGSLYTSIDLDNFFSSIPCSELASKLLSFHCSHGSFSYLRLCQGWSSSPGVASALGARLTSVLDKDTLGLFVDDGLIVGRFRYVGRDKLDMLMPFGDVEAVLEEDKAIWEREGRPIRGEQKRAPAKGATNIQGLNGLTQKENTDPSSLTTKENGVGWEPICQASPPSEKLDESKSETKTFSPTDLFFPEDQTAENTCQTFISPGVDMLIKFHDMLKAIVGFNLRLSGGKLRMFSFCCDYLGFKISAEGIKMQPKYLSTITKYKIPKNPVTLKNFLGVCQYFASQAPALHRYTARLYEAANRKIEKGKTWELSREEKLDFFHAKLCFLRSDGLGFPDLSNLQENPLRLWNDFSTLSISSILTQVQKDRNGNYRDVLIGVFGRKCPKVLQSASSAVGESHALCFGLMKYQQLLQLGIFDIFSDHLNLKFLNSWQNLRGIYFRLYQMITQFVFRLFTISTSEMLAADLISRIDHQEMTWAEKRALGMGEAGWEIFDDFQNGDEEQPKDLDIKQHWAPQKQQFLLWAENKENPGENIIERGNESVFVGEMVGGKWMEGGYTTKGEIGGRACWNSDETQDNITWGEQETEVGRVENSSGPGWNVEPMEQETDHAISCHPSHSNRLRPSALRSGHNSVQSPQSTRHNGSSLSSSHDHSLKMMEVTDDTKASLVCDEFRSNRNCKHMKFKFPLGRPELKVYEFSCLPFRHRSQVIAELGPDHSNLFQSISRFEILKEQRRDRNIQKAIYFTQHGWPSLENIKQLYPTKTLMEMFYSRDTLSCAADGLFIKARNDQEYALEERTVVPLSLTYHVFCLAHLSSKAFHNSIHNTYIALNFRYYIPQLNKILRYFISRCVVCLQKAKKPNRLLRMPVNVPNFIKSEAKFNERIYLDLSGCLVESYINKFRYFLLIIDRFSLFIETVPLRTVHSEEVKLAFLNSWVSRYGPSTISISDVGSQFTAEPFQQMLKDLNMTHRFSNTSLPRSELAEVGIARIKDHLKSCLSSCEDHSDWPLALMMAKLSHNSRISQAKLVSPAELALGEPPALDLWWLSRPGKRNQLISGPVEHTRHQVVVHRRLDQSDLDEQGKKGEKTKQSSQKSIWSNGQVQFPISPIFFGNKQNLDLTRLRKNDPIRLMSKEPSNDLLDSPLIGHFLRAGLAAMISDNQLLVYARSKPTLSKAKNELFPLTQRDVGKLVFRFNPVPKTHRQAAGSLSAAWQGPLMISSVYNEITCIVEGILKGRHVAYRSPIDQIRPFYDIEMNNIPSWGCSIHEDDSDGADTKADEDDDDHDVLDEEDGKEEDADDEGLYGDGDDQVHQVDEGRDYHEVATLLPKEKVPQARWGFVKTQHRTHRLMQACQDLLNIPGSDLICINPESELIKLGHEAIYNKIKVQMEESKSTDRSLIFHQIFDLKEESKTRTQRQKVSELIDLERCKMLQTREVMEENQDLDNTHSREKEADIVVCGDKEVDSREENVQDREEPQEEGEVDRMDPQGEEGGRESDHSGGMPEGATRSHPGEGQEPQDKESFTEEEEATRVQPEARHEHQDEESCTEEEGENEGEFVSAEEEEEEEETEGTTDEREEDEIRGDAGKDVDDADDNDLVDDNVQRDEKPTKFASLAKTVSKRMAGHLPEGTYWKLKPGSRRRRKE